MYIPLTRKDIVVETASIDWDEIVKDFSELSLQEIYNELIRIRYPRDQANRLASAIYIELNG